VPIILFADNEELLSLDLFLYLKLNGFMMTNTAPEVLTAIMSLVIIGEIYIPATLVSNLPYEALQKEKNARFDEQIPINIVKKLTPRQCDVLELLHYGLSNKVIADRLDIRESTVKVHMSAIMKKLGVNNRTQAAYLGKCLS
jgi:two-component system nitrate/nitrite response regulator NarL